MTTLWEMFKPEDKQEEPKMTPPKMLRNYVMISDLPLAEKTASGLITDLGIKAGKKARDQVLWDAEVIAVSDKWKDKLPVGSIVKYDPYNGGYDITWGGRECFVTYAENLHAVIEGYERIEQENY